MLTRAVCSLFCCDHEQDKQLSITITISIRKVQAAAGGGAAGHAPVALTKRSSDSDIEGQGPRSKGVFTWSESLEHEFAQHFR